MRKILFFILCSLFIPANDTYGQGDGETYQMNGLEVTLPDGFSAYSRVIDGILQTEIKKDGWAPISKLIVSVSDMEEEISEDDFLEGMKLMREQFSVPGLELGPNTIFYYKGKIGVQIEGNGTMGGVPCKIIFKFFMFSHYAVQFQEWYGENYSEDFYFIEQSLRLGNNNNLHGMQTISYNGCSFDYNADKLFASAKEADNVTTFAFSFKDPSYGGSFLEIDFSFLSNDLSYTYALEWFDIAVDVFSRVYDSFNMKPMEKITFMGKSGYQRTGMGIETASGKKIIFTIKICKYDNYFVKAYVQQTVNQNGQTPKEVEKIFKAIEESLKITD